MKSRICAIGAIAGGLLFPHHSNADVSISEVLNGLTAIRYESGGGFALGDTFSITSQASPLNRCIAYDRANGVKTDSPGAIGSILTTSVVTNLEEFERTTKFSFSSSASMGFSFGKALGGGAESNQNGKFERFAHEESQSLLVVMEASADHGRDYIEDFSLKSEYKALIDGNKKKEFIASCGTHFIRGVSKRSAVRIVFSVTGLSKEAKSLISYHFDAATRANATIKLVSADAKASFGVDISDALRFSSKLGKLSYDITATGGLGIATLGKSLKAADLANFQDFKHVMEALTAVSADFNSTNSAPDRYIIVPHPGLSVDDVGFDAKRYSSLGAIYKAILRVDERLSIYNGYKAKNSDLWSKYFRIYTEEASALRVNLLKKYVDCRNGESCEFDSQNSVRGLLLDDVAFDGKLSASCPLGNSHVEGINRLTASKTDYISAIMIEWSGKLRYLDDIDIDGIELYRISPNMNLEQIPVNVRRQVNLKKDVRASDEARALVSFPSVTPDARKVIENDQVNLNYLASFRRDIARSVFGIKFSLRNGFQIDEPLGFPDLKNCKIVDEVN